MAKIVKKLQPKPKVKVQPKKGEPTYKNLPMGVSLEEEERSGYRKEGIKPSKQDSAAYKQGYGRGMQGGKGYAGESPIGRMGRWEGQNAKPKAAAPKKKMQAGGVMKPAKRVGPIDPNGAWTKVQERTIAGKKAPKVPLKKDKQLGATKMKMGGVVEKAKGGKWIQKAIKKPGALRAQLGAKPGEPIPAGKLAKAAKAKGKLGQRARLAQTLKRMKK
jgi:hypothetical protein